MSEEATLGDFTDAKESDSTNLELGPIELDIPEGWESTELSNLFNLITGNNYSGDKLSDDDNGGRIFLTLKSINKGGGFNWNSLKYYLGEVNEREVVKPGELLIANTDVTQNGDIIGYSARVPHFDSEREIAASMDLSILRPISDSINLPYTEYLLQTDQIHSRMRAFSAGSTVLHLNTDLVKSLFIPLPPLPEQRKIATILYTVDRAIEKTSELIEQLGRVKQGIRQNILTSGITEENKLRASPESEPEQYTDARQWTVPNSWELKELSDICSIQVGYAFKSDWYQEEGNVRVLRGANVGYGEPDWSETYFLEPERVSEYEDYLLNEGNLIIGMDRPYTNSGFKISRLSETDVPSLLVQRVGRFVPERCDPDYLHVVLSDWRYQKQVLRRAQGMDIPHISQTDILSPKIPLPPLDEQKRIANRYSSILERIDCEENLLREYKTLKQGLMQDLLSGTVRTTDTNIEVPDEIAQHG